MDRQDELLPAGLGLLLVAVGLLGALGGCAGRACPPASQSSAERTTIIRSGAEAPHRRTIRVNGIARLDVTPDVVDVQITQAARAERPKAAVTALRAQHEQLLKKLLDAGLKDAVKLSHVDVNPVRRPHPDSHLSDGYEATVTMVVTLKDLTRLGDLLELAADHEVKHVSTLFRSTKIPEHKRQLREMALLAARRKAEQMAQVMQVQLGEVLAIEESAGTQPGWGSLSNENAFMPATEPGGPVQPGALPLSLTVEISFELKQAPTPAEL